MCARLPWATERDWRGIVSASSSITVHRRPSLCNRLSLSLSSLGIHHSRGGRNPSSLSPDTARGSSDTESPAAHTSCCRRSFRVGKGPPARNSQMGTISDNGGLRDHTQGQTCRSSCRGQFSYRTIAQYTHIQPETKRRRLKPAHRKDGFHSFQLSATFFHVGRMTNPGHWEQNCCERRLASGNCARQGKCEEER